MADRDNTIYKATTPPQVKRMHKSGNSNTRSVSGTKKKYIAAQQDWKCKHCGAQLDAWYEVDHILRLDVYNLITLLRIPYLFHFGNTSFGLSIWPKYSILNRVIRVSKI